MFYREVLKRDFGENEWPRGREKFQFWEYFESCLKVVRIWLSYSTLGPYGGALKIFWVLGCFREKSWKVNLVIYEWSRVGQNLQFLGWFQTCLKIVGIWLCDTTLGTDCAAMKILGIFGSLREKYWKWFLWKFNDRRVGRNFNFGNVLVLWVLRVELWRSFEFWGVLERSIGKAFWWKIEWPRGGRNFNFRDIFKFALMWLECDYVIVLCLLIV